MRSPQGALRGSAAGSRIPNARSATNFSNALLLGTSGTALSATRRAHSRSGGSGPRRSPQTARSDMRFHDLVRGDSGTLFERRSAPSLTRADDLDVRRFRPKTRAFARHRRRIATSSPPDDHGNGRDSGTDLTSAE